MEVFANHREKRSWLEIDLNTIRDNLRAYRSLLPADTKVMIVTKADAYGHGDVRVSWKLIQEGIDCFAVSNIDEAMVLRDAGVESDILILGYTSPIHAATLYRYNLTQTILSPEYLDAMIATGLKIRCQVAVDTGMRRIGIDSCDVEACRRLILKAHSHLDLKGIFTHLCVADSYAPEDTAFTEKQIRSFINVADSVKHLNLPYVHCYNSAGGLRYAHCEEFAPVNSWVRLGIILYGLHPSDEISLPEGVRMALKWKSVISMVKDVAPGESIGYGRTFVADKPMRVATIPTGYADGYRRELSNQGHVMIAGRFAPIVGRVCMDQFMVDVTGIPEAEMGAEVVLLGDCGDISYTADDMARQIGTIGYEILCGISKRVQRYYI